MDNIVWYLYFADVVNNLNTAVGIIIMLSILSCIAFFIICTVKWCSDEEDEEDEAKKSLKFLKYSLYACVISSLIGCFVPSHRTIYASAGLKIVQQTETGHILTDDVKSILQDVKTIIHKQAEK